MEHHLKKWKNIQFKDKSTTEYAGQFDYTRMFERDPVNANALRRGFHLAQ